MQLCQKVFGILKGFFLKALKQVPPSKLGMQSPARRRHALCSVLGNSYDYFLQSSHMIKAAATPALRDSVSASMGMYTLRVQARMTGSDRP